MKSPSRRILVRLSATHADKIRAAFGKAIDSEQVAQSFGETYFAGETITPQTARDWAKVHILVHKAPLVEALKRTYADGWVTGDTSARYVLSHLVRRTKAIEAPRVGVVNWAIKLPQSCFPLKVDCARFSIMLTQLSREFQIQNLTGSEPCLLKHSQRE